MERPELLSYVEFRREPIITDLLFSCKSSTLSSSLDEDYPYYLDFSRFERFDFNLLSFFKTELPFLSRGLIGSFDS